MALVNFAVDFGNGYVKAKSNKASFVYSSKLGHQSDLGTSSLNELEDTGLSIHVFNRKDEPSYVMGRDLSEAIEPSKLINTSGTSNRYSVKNFKRLIDFVLADLASYEDNESVDVRLVTGMPSHELSMPSKRDAFHNYLEGRHIAKKNGKEYVVNVVELKIIEQPMGTLLNEFMNDQGKVHKALTRGNVVVVDLGSGTTIIDNYKNIKRVGGEVMNSGMNQFLSNIAKKMSNQTGVSFTPEQINQGLRNQTYKAEDAQASYPFDRLFHEETAETIDNIIGKYMEVVEQE